MNGEAVSDLTKHTYILNIVSSIHISNANALLRFKFIGRF